MHCGCYGSMSNNASPSSRRRQRWLVVGCAIAGLASFSGLAYTRIAAIQMVSSGRSLATYRTFWLVEFNGVGFLGPTAAVVLALVIALVLRPRENVQRRSLERKYGGHKQRPHMKPVTVAALLLVALLFSIPPAFAAGKIDCSGISFSEARSLVELPGEVGALLGTGRRGSEGIADRGAKFNATDVILDEQLPWRRFGLAAVSASCILVAVEHGGRGYSVELWAFARSGDRWRGEQRQSIFSVPRSMQELIAHAGK